MRVLGEIEAFRCLIPICAYSLGCQLYLLLVLSNDLAKTKVSDLDLPVVENNILWLQIIVNDLLLLIVEIFES